ncbi:MAG: hypothetical protein PHI58_00445 [Candidatus Omnitrophica bacterium]|nr:hypothetical protein [Candidatus Omnitrophota bacterium]
MKKITGLFIVSFIICAASMAMPAAIKAEQDAKKEKEDSVFQKAGDVIKGKYEVETVPFKKIGIFQKMADGISGLSRQ